MDQIRTYFSVGILIVATLLLQHTAEAQSLVMGDMEQAKRQRLMAGVSRAHKPSRVRNTPQVQYAEPGTRSCEIRIGPDVGQAASTVTGARAALTPARGDSVTIVNAPQICVVR